MNWKKNVVDGWTYSDGCVYAISPRNPSGRYDLHKQGELIKARLSLKGAKQFAEEHASVAAESVELGGDPQPANDEPPTELKLNEGYLLDEIAVVEREEAKEFNPQYFGDEADPLRPDSPPEESEECPSQLTLYEGSPSEAAGSPADASGSPREGEEDSIASSASVLNDPHATNGHTAVLTKPDIQTALDLFVWREGDPRLGDNEELLAEYGLEKGDFTDAMVEKSLRHTAKRLKDSFVEHNGRPDRAFLVVVQGDPDLDPEINPELPGPARDRKEQKEKEIRERIEKMQAGRRAKAYNDSDREAPTEDEIMKVDETQARKMTTSLGYASAGGWPTAKLAAVLNRLDQADGLSEVEGDDKQLFDSILKALKTGKEIAVTIEKDGVVATVLADTPRKKRGKKDSGSVGKRKEPPKKEKPAKKTKPSNGESVEVDKFGSRFGTERAKVNARLSKEPKTVQQLADEAGLKNTYFRKHLASLISEGFVVKTKDGYKLK